MARKFFRQVFTVEVLSEDEPLGADTDLADIAYAITEGENSGKVDCTVTEEVDEKKMASLLLSQGSDPGFFRIEEDAPGSPEEPS